MSISGSLESCIIQYKNIFNQIPLSKLFKIKSLLESVHETYYIIRDPETPLVYGIIGLLGILWVVFPFDFDFIPILGMIDDMFIFGACNKIVHSQASPETVSHARERSMRASAEAIVEAGETIDDKTSALSEDIQEAFGPLITVGKYWLSFLAFVYRHQESLKIIFITIIAISIYFYFI